MADKAPEPAYLISPTGDIVGVDQSDAQSALGAGYAPASPEQIKDYTLQKKYGGVGQQIATGAEGLGDALTLGLSTLTETALGVPAEDIKGREEANPVSHGFGTGIGIAAPMLVTGGLAGVAEGGVKSAASVTAPAMISRAGQGVTRAVESVLPEAAGIGGKMLAKGVAGAAGSAVEGAWYGAGQVVHEAALGDPNLTAQSILGQIGLSAALGGAVGLLGGVGEVGIPAALEKAKEATGNLLTKARDGFVEAYPGIVEKITGGEVSATKVTEALRRRAEFLDNPKTAEEVGKNLGKALDEHYSSMEKALETATRDSRQLETDELSASVDPAKAKGETIRLMDRFQAVRDEMRAQPELYPEAFPKKLEALRSSVWRDYSKETTPGEAFSKLNTMKRKLEDLGRFGKDASPDHADAVSAIRALRNEVKESLENEGVWSQAAARQASFDEVHVDYLAARKQFDKFFTADQAAGGSVVDPEEVVKFVGQLQGAKGELKAKALDEYVDVSRRLIKEIDKTHQAAPVADFDRAAFRGLVNKTGKMTVEARKQASLAALTKSVGGGAMDASGMAGGLGAIAGAPLLGHMIPGAAPVAALYGAAKSAYGLLQKAKDVPAAVATLAGLERSLQSMSGKLDYAASAIARGVEHVAPMSRSEVSAGIAKSFGKSTEDSAAQFMRRVAEVNKYQDPTQLQAALEKQTSGLQDHAPQTAQAIAVTTARKVSFLGAKVPHPPQLGPLAPRWEASRADIAKFNRYYEAVNKPATILKQIAAGTLTPEAVEAVRSTDPHLFEAMQHAVLNKIAANPGKATYRAKLGVAMLLGRDLDGTMTPAAIMANQISIAGPSSKAPENQTGPSAGPSAKAASAVTLSSRMMTPSQASSQRGQ